MAPTYSQNIRNRVISKIESGKFTRAKVAENLQVSVVYVDEVMSRYRHTGSREALPWNGGPRRVLETHEAWIREVVSKTPDITLAKLCARLKKEKKVKVSTSMMGRELALLNLSRKQRVRV